MAPLNICLQVNISGEASKSGAAPDELPELARTGAALPNLRLRGLMAIPEPNRPGIPCSAPRSPCAGAVRRRCAPTACARYAVDGHVGRFAAAIAEGATIVRVGSAIFGDRNYD
jgi:uncharacterized pyridoxal phosphate-containing UPF0001 family protein